MSSKDKVMVHIKMDADLHQKMKMWTALKEVSVTQFVTELIARELSKEE